MPWEDNYTNYGPYYFDPGAEGGDTVAPGTGFLEQWYIGPNGQLMSTGGTPLGLGNTPPPAPAPTQSQVNSNPSQFTGTSFDPSRYLTYPGSMYGNGTGNGNPNLGFGSSSMQGGGRAFEQSGQQGYQGPATDPTRRYGNGYWNAQNDPTGQNHNIYANFLSRNTDLSTPSGRIANVISQMLTSGEAPMRQAQEWLRNNVAPGATTMNPGANTTDILRSWGQLNNGISTNGNATPGVGGLGNGIDPTTGGSVITQPTQNTQGNGEQTGGGGGGPQYRILQMPNGMQYRYRLTGNQLKDDMEIARLQASWASGSGGGSGGGGGTQQTQVNPLDAHNAAIDNMIRLQRGMGPNEQVTDAMRTAARFPTRGQLELNAQNAQSGQALGADAFVGGIPTGVPYLPNSAAPAGFKWKWYDPDGATGQLPGNYALSLVNAPTDYASYQSIYNTAYNPAYNNKLLDFGLNANRYANAFSGSMLNQSDYGRLMNIAQSPFYGTALGNNNALGNYITSQGPTAVSSALGTGAYENKSGQGTAANYVDPYANQSLVSHAYDPGVDGSGLSSSQLAPVNRDWNTYPGTGVPGPQGNNSSLTSSGGNTTTPAPTSPAPTTPSRPEPWDDSAYYRNNF